MYRKLYSALLVMTVVGCGSAGPTSSDGPALPPGAPSVASAAPPPMAAAGASAAAPASMTSPAATTATSPQPMAATPAATAPMMPAPSTDGTAAPVATMTAVPGAPITKECQGFNFDGLLYSPGGAVLPNKCAPFHATLNNPFAVRCVDVWPWFKTEYAGDNFCVLPPAPGMGVQVGHHPQGEYDAWLKAVSKGDMSGYDKANIPAGWILQPGAEEERNITIRHMNEAGNYWRTQSRMRGGSHHMINSTTTDFSNTFTWGPGGPDGLFSGSPVPGSQRPDDNSPQSFDIPAEDVGLYRELPENVGVLFNMHHFNATDKPILKEAWENLWWTDTATQKVSGVGGLAVEQAIETLAQPGDIVDWHYAITAPGPVRILGLFGHRHAWTTNFSAWVVRKGGSPEIVYQSFDWFNEPTYQYNSQVQNPMPAYKDHIDGGSSGILRLDQGDELHFNCHIEYTDQRAIEEKSPVMPKQNGALRFANEAFTAEMCILFGGAVGMNGTATRQGDPPDFAKAR